MEKQWRTIPGFDRYEASPSGEIRSKPRFWMRKYKDGKDRPSHTKGKVLTPIKDGCGYLRTMISNGDRYVTIKVHRIICATFNIVDNWERMEVNHKNGIKDDNRASNLEFCTREENISHSFNAGLQDNFIRASRMRAKEGRGLNRREYYKFMDNYNSGIKAPTLAKIYGLSKKTAYCIIKGITYKDFREDYEAKRGNKTNSS